MSESFDANVYGEPEAHVVRLGDPVTGTIIFSEDLTRDDLGRIATRNELIWSPMGDEVRGLTYAYDDAGRLGDVYENAAHVAKYEYDANGNRLRKSNPSVAGTNEDGEYDAQDRLWQYAGNTYHYTQNGELALKSTAAGDTEYAYDALGNLRSVVLGAGSPNEHTITYDVDGQNHRIWKSVDGLAERGFVYRDQLRIVAELDENGSVVARFVYGSRPNVPDYMVTSSGTFRIVSDHLGSPRLVVSVTTGAVMQRIDYDEFGKVLADSDPGFQPFGFAGGLYDADTGLVRFGARDYDAQTGRWTAKDKLLFAANDTNLYNYAFLDPINLSDVTGMDVAVCSARALSCYPFSHEWLRTDTKEAGMGGSGVLDIWVEDHSLLHSEFYPDAECETVPDVDEACVNAKLQIGQDLGVYFPGINDCQTFVASVLSECSTKDVCEPEYGYYYEGF